MKRIIAILLVLVIATLCACGDEAAPAKKKKKKVVYIQREPSSSVEDTSSNDSTQEESEEEDYEYDEDNYEENNQTYTDTYEETVTVTSAVKKLTSSDIGKNYYLFAPEVDHPGVAELDAEYKMVAKDRRGVKLDSEKIVISCTNKDVKIDGDILTIPYSVRKTGEKVTVTMYNKDHKNRTGSFTFDFAVQYTDKPTFLDEFDTLDTTIWKDDWYEDRMPIEELYCEDGELVMYANENSKSIELSTTGTFNQAYGSFSARIKMPKGGLSNIAFWLCTEKGVTYLKNPQRPSQSGGEIDIVEYFPTWGDHRTSCTVHWNGWSNYHQGVGEEPQVSQVLRNEYHIYSCVWTSTAIYFYLDEDLIWTYTGEGVGPNAGPMQLLLQHTNTKQDSSWGGKYDPAEFPNESRWDYVKVYGLKAE